VPIAITMPALSPTMTKGHLLVWHKNINDLVQTGDLLLEIETDKATMEVESTQSGILDHIAVPAGSNDVTVGTYIAVLRNPEEAKGIGHQWLGAQGVNMEQATPQPASVPEIPQEKTDMRAPERTLDQGQSPLVQDAGTQSEHAQIILDQGASVAAFQAVLSHAEAQEGWLGHDAQNRILSSPLARKWANQHKIDLSTLCGTGPRGRIVKDDVIAALAMPKRPRVPATGQAYRPESGTDLAHSLATSAGTSFAGSAGPRSSGTAVASSGTPKGIAGNPGAPDQASSRVPLSGMRRTIAQRLTLSKQSVPHFSLTLECNMDALLRVRQQMNGDTKELSVNDFMVRACALALREVPEMRLMWGDEQHAIQHEQVDLALAVSIPGGLITPIVRQADTKSLRVLSAELKTLIARSRQGQLTSSEYQGGLFTLSNLGMMGIDQFTPIINPPHTGILAIGATKKRPIVGADGTLSVGQTMYATIAADHRTIDGSVAATFLTTFQRLIEHPFSLVS
jgi:pyruvate dehydrogenase E2 component (dihydrolipoamide acetyltransferase)